MKKKFNISAKLIRRVKDYEDSEYAGVLTLRNEKGAWFECIVFEIRDALPDGEHSLRELMDLEKVSFKDFNYITHFSLPAFGELLYYLEKHRVDVDKTILTIETELTDEADLWCH